MFTTSQSFVLVVIRVYGYPPNANATMPPRVKEVKAPQSFKIADRLFPGNKTWHSGGLDFRNPERVSTNQFWLWIKSVNSSSKTRWRNRYGVYFFTPHIYIDPEFQVHLYSFLQKISQNLLATWISNISLRCFLGSRSQRWQPAI